MESVAGTSTAETDDVVVAQPDSAKAQTSGTANPVQEEAKADLTQGDVIGAWKVLNRIGEGTYGTVCRCIDHHGEFGAIKAIKLTQLNEGIPSTAIREIALLRELRHPHIVSMKHVIIKEDALYMLFELLTTDLKKYMDAHDDPLPLPTVRSFIYQLLKGVHHLHDEMQILHRDLKPQNLLLSADGVLKIADFGLARGIGIPANPYTHEVVTLWYRPPDVLLGNQFYSGGLDMWSTGCVLAELVMGKPLFPGKDTDDQLKRIFRILGTPTESDFPPGCTSWKGWHPEDFPVYRRNRLRELLLIYTSDLSLIDLICNLLQYNPEKRISSEEALKHLWFEEEPAQCAPRPLSLVPTSKRIAAVKERRQRRQDFSTSPVSKLLQSNSAQSTPPDPSADEGTPGTFPD